jgi:CHAT domain-containing protein
LRGSWPRRSGNGIDERQNGSVDRKLQRWTTESKQRLFAPLNSGNRRAKRYFLDILALLFLCHLTDMRPGGTRLAYDYVWRLFQQGKLEVCQHVASEEANEFRISNPEWASRFVLLEAEAMVWRGSFTEALGLLGNQNVSGNPADSVHKLAIEAVALIHQDQNAAASQKLSQAENLCNMADYAPCGDVIRARGIQAIEQGDSAAARERFLQTFSFGEAHGDRWLQATAAANLGRASILSDHFDEALDWSKTAYRDSEALNAQHIAQIAAGNLGWAYFQLGDEERALQQFLNAEQSAAALGSVSSELNWMLTAGYVYRDNDDLARATESYRRALALARQIDSKEDIVNALEDLAEISVEAGKLDEADAYIAQLTPMETANGDHLSANDLLTRGKLAAARKQDTQAESLFKQVQNDAASATTTRLNAGYELALLDETRGDLPAAESMYRATLAIFDTAQAALKSEESQLPFVANAARIYDDYIQLLVREGKGDEALQVADRSRARTLAQGAGSGSAQTSAHKGSVDPRAIARKTGATLLFYWLGRKQSYLWVITPAKVALIPLPAQQEIRERIDRYSKTLNDVRDPLASRNQDAQALYQTLVAPAASLLRPNAPVILLADGALSELNFETLLAPANAKDAEARISNPGLHYWIDDATVLSAPSLAMLAAAKPAAQSDGKLLLLGNPISPSDDFPTLPLFGFEMTRIAKHFAPQRVSAVAGQQATPAAYLSGNPARFAYIHFVTHAVASRTDPLDSAIILSDALPGAGAYKLYARDVMQHPIDAELVTISACDGVGKRAYVGEGLVGLSWAFLHAGAHSVIGALWEASDDSTPRLMDSLYSGIQEGDSPAAALRKAKLTLLHGDGKFAAPFYWAPFQIYTAR